MLTTLKLMLTNPFEPRAAETTTAPSTQGIGDGKRDLRVSSQEKFWRVRKNFWRREKFLTCQEKNFGILTGLQTGHRELRSQCRIHQQPPASKLCVCRWRPLRSLTRSSPRRPSHTTTQHHYHHYTHQCTGKCVITTHQCTDKCVT